MMENLHRQKQFFLAKIIFGALLVIIIAIFIFDGRAIQNALHQAQWHLILVAMIFTCVSLFFATESLVIICKIFDLHIPRRKLFKVSFITVALNNLIQAGGVAGYSVRILLLKTKKVGAEEILSASLFHSYLNLLVIIIFLPFSFTFLWLSEKFTTKTEIILGLAVLISVLLFVFFTLLFVYHGFRFKCANAICNTVNRITKKDFGATFNDLHIALTNGIELVKKRKSQMVWLILVLLIDWACTLSVLWLSFKTLGITMTPGVMLTGLFIGVVAGQVSVIPGGIGVQEGSSAGIYSLLGIPFGIAIIALILYRFIYYIVPFLVAMFMYWRILHKLDRNKIE